MRARIILALLHLLAIVPLPINHACGSLLGWLLYLIPNQQRRVALINLQRCYPTLTPTQQKQMLRRTLIETGKTFTESGILWFRSKQYVLSLVRKISGEEYPQTALQKGQGVLMATPHLGAWEMAGLYSAHHFALTTLYRPPRLKSLEVPIRRARERTGATMVPTTHKGVRVLYQCLAQGGAVGMLPDQDPGREAGCFASFFGIQANTMVLLARLVRRSKAKMVFGFAERLSWGRGYYIHFLPGPEDIYSHNLAQACEAVNQGVEACIQHSPEQYLWVYKRFKTRPKGEKKFY